MNMIRKVSVAIKGGPGAAGFYIYKTAAKLGRLFVNRGGTEYPIASSRVKVMGTSDTAYTATIAEDGTTFVSNNSSGTFTLTLPLAATAGAGTKFRLLTGVLPGAGAGTTLTPNSADKFQGNGFNAKTAGQTLVNSAATDAVGDLVEVVSDGGTIWYVVSKVGTWA